MYGHYCALCILFVPVAFTNVFGKDLSVSNSENTVSEQACKFIQVPKFPYAKESRGRI